MSDIASFAERLRSAGFLGDIEHGPGTTAVYGTDNSIYQTAPVAAVVPTSIDDLAVLARLNHDRDEPFSLTARGGGTGTNGQSLTNGIVVDTRRAMNRIVSIDADARQAVVEPGVVLDELNHRLRPHGLLFAPHTSTATRCTIGGMVATDAAGKGSLVHGRTNQHVLAIDAVLADGTRATFPNSGEMPPSGRLAELHEQLSAVVDDLDPGTFPDMPRGFTGYNLADAAATDTGVDVTKLLCGSEGTLALLGRITVGLTPLPSTTHLAIVAHPTFEEALREANRLKASRPTAIECLDERTISLADASPAWPTLARLLPAESAALLLLEFDDDDHLHEFRSMVSDDTHVAIVSDAAVIAAVWKVRADAVGLLGQPVDGRRSVAFVEDCAVPPHRLQEFVAEFRAVLDGHGLSYGMFGHADVGCIHVRPALDLSDPAHEALIRTISDEVAALVARFGGVLWGEHGRGFRGEYLDLDDDLVHRMRRVKTAFDPFNVLNPGKLYAPLDTDVPIVRIDEVPLRVHTHRLVGADDRDDYTSAFDCNGNGICHHWGEAEAMCPSYKVTLDPRLSPKGRADLTRAWLADPTDRRLADDLADSMRRCLSCGACTGRCPVQVDVPELKSRFLERHRDSDRRRRLRTALLSRFESLLPIAQRAAPVIRTVQRATGPALRHLLGVVDLPAVPSGTLAARLAAHGVSLVGADDPLGDASVVILPDAFSGYLDPAVLEAAIVVLRAVGERPVVGPFVPSGKLDHVTGRRARFAATVARRRALVEQLRDRGAALVVIEPAVALLPRHEYRHVDVGYPADAVMSVVEFLADRIDRLPPAGSGASVQLFEHCTESSLASATTAAYRAMLEAVGHEVTVEATSCCGMAGVFGHELEHQAMSRDLFDRAWRPKLSDPGFDLRCASGYSCRSQANRFGFGDLVHPLVHVAASIELTNRTTF